MVQARLVAPLAELVSEPGIRKRPTQIVNEECEFSAF
jgi:hypothetical protein